MIHYQNQVDQGIWFPKIPISPPNIEQIHCRSTNNEKESGINYPNSEK